jgi:ribonuclease HI
VRIDELLEGRSVDFRYVPAHQVDGDRLNDFADRAASQAATVQEAAGSALGSPEPPPSPDTPVARAPRRKPPAKGAGSSSRTIKAKFPGRCLCGRSYAAGEAIAKNPQGWGHPECRTSEA